MNAGAKRGCAFEAAFEPPQPMCLRNPMSHGDGPR